MLKHEFPVGIDVLAKAKTDGRLAQQARESSLAGPQRFTPQILPVQGKQIEHVQERNVIVLTRAQEFK